MQYECECGTLVTLEPIVIGPHVTDDLAGDCSNCGEEITYTSETRRDDYYADYGRD
jgi:hypothetical protein